MKIGFELTNLTNDKTICMVPVLTQEVIENAIKFQQIELNDIGVVILDLENPNA